MRDLTTTTTDTMIEIIDRDGIQTVSARDLHEKLGIGAHFKDWMPRMIAYGFTENVDYVTVAQKRATAQGNLTTYNEYYISLDMAKEICMIQRSDIGRKFRQYFIDCEKKLKEVAPKTYIEAVEKLLVTLKENEKLEQQHKEDQHEIAQTKEDALTVVGWGKLKTVNAYAIVHHKNWDLETKKQIGKQLAAISRLKNLNIGKAEDPKYGFTNAYTDEAWALFESRNN